MGASLRAVEIMGHLNCTFWSQLSGVSGHNLCLTEGYFRGLSLLQCHCLLLLLFGAEFWFVHVFRVTPKEAGVDWTSLQWKNGTPCCC